MLNKEEIREYLNEINRLKILDKEAARYYGNNANADARSESIERELIKAKYNYAKFLEVTQEELEAAEKKLDKLNYEPFLEILARLEVIQSLTSIEEPSKRLLIKARKIYEEYINYPSIDEVKIKAFTARWNHPYTADKKWDEFRGQYPNLDAWGLTLDFYRKIELPNEEVELIVWRNNRSEPENHDLFCYFNTSYLENRPYKVDWLSLDKESFMKDSVKLGDINSLLDRIEINSLSTDKMFTREIVNLDTTLFDAIKEILPYTGTLADLLNDKWDEIKGTLIYMRRLSSKSDISTQLNRIKSEYSV